MKVLIVGGSGMIGGEALAQCLAHPRISRVVAFVRRDLPASVSENPKLQSVVVKDFAVWPEDILEEHAEAVGMIWAMGAYNGSVTADYEYPLAFQESMVKILESKSPRDSRFRYIQLGGKFVRQNQEEKLWFMEKPRKLKGLLVTKMLALAESHSSVWQAFVVRPGGVVPNNALSSGVVGIMATVMGAGLGPNWAVRIDELGAFMVFLAIDGSGEESLIENARIVQRGQELLKETKIAT